MLGGNAWARAQQLHENPFDTPPKKDEGNELPPEPTPSPERRKADLRRLVQAKFQRARDDELIAEYEHSTAYDNPRVREAVRKYKETRAAEDAQAMNDAVVVRTMELHPDHQQPART